MPEAQVAAAYGPPRSVRTTAYSRGAPRVTVATYRAHSGQLSIVYDGAVVVGVSTTSPYYTTAAGHGVGVPFAPTNGTWLACLGVYRQIVGGVTTDFATQGAQKFGRVVRASLLRRGYRDPGCQGAVR